MILIVGSNPIPGDLMIAYGFSLFSNAFGMFLIDFNRRPSPDFRLSYDFHWFAWFSDDVAVFLVDFSRRPSPDLRLSYNF